MIEEIRQVYNTISDYVTNPTFLNTASAVFLVGGTVCFGYSIKLIADIRKRIKIEENNGLEEKLVR